MDQLPLKDIHLPDAVSAWPPAPGWYLLAVLIPLTILAALFIYKRIKQQSVLKTAAKMLKQIENDTDQNSLHRLAAISIWLRRVAISIAPRANVASLSGEAWLAYLDSGFQDAPFSQGVGRYLLVNQYQRTIPEDVDFHALFQLCKRWLKFQRIGKSATLSKSSESRA